MNLQCSVSFCYSYRKWSESWSNSKADWRWENTVIRSLKGALKSMFVYACVGIFDQEESQKVRAETKLDINLENSRVFDMVCV